MTSRLFAPLPLIALALLAGCASGSLLPPEAFPARLYSPAEKLRPGPWNDVNMDGEVRYCTSLDVGNGAAKGAELKKSALANINKACGGKDDYAIVSETLSDADYLAAGGMIRSGCPATTGRTLHFKCNRGGTGTTKTPR